MFEIKIPHNRPSWRFLEEVNSYVEPRPLTLIYSFLFFYAWSCCFSGLFFTSCAWGMVSAGFTILTSMTSEHELTVPHGGRRIRGIYGCWESWHLRRNNVTARVGRYDFLFPSSSFCDGNHVSSSHFCKSMVRRIYSAAIEWAVLLYNRKGRAFLHLKELPKSFSHLLCQEKILLCLLFRE